MKRLNPTRPNPSHALCSRQRNRLAPFAATLALTTALTGCGVGSTAISPNSATSAVHLSGKLYGGQQPVSGATLQLYAAGSTGYSSAATPLLNQTVTTRSDGTFTITGDYTCPANGQLYIVATGGNPGLTPSTATNPNLALMTGLGGCGNLTPNTNIMINELTTVASVWALSRFMSGYASVGTSPGNATGLANAFAVIPELVDTAVGVTPGPALPANAVLPSTELNTLADALAACINSPGGAAGDTSLCGQLFSAANTSSSNAGAPQNTIAAAINLARNPTLGTATVFGLAASGSPFQPTLTAAPQNFSIAITYSGGGLSAPTAVAPDASGNIWVANSGNSTLTELSPTGAAVSPAAGFTGGGLNKPSALAIDEVGTVWVTNRSGNSVSLFNASGTSLAASPVTGGGLSAPSSIAIDEDGSAWIANAGNNSLTAISSTYMLLSPGTGYTGAGLNQPAAIAINSH
jgi:hypothetical protein